MLLFGSEAKARAGEDTIFTLRLPRPPSAAPTLTAKVTAGTVNVGAMAALWTEATVASVSASDRTQLNLSAAVADARGLAADYGHAWLVSDETAPVEVRVMRFVGGGSPVAHLADPLPREHSGAGTLVPAWYSATLTALAVTGTAQRNALLAVSWTEDSGTDAPAFSQALEVDLHIVREPFATGVTEADVLRIDASLASQASEGDINARDAIGAALEEVIIRLREDLAERALWEDDVPRAFRAPLARCHAHLAAATILDAYDPAAAAQHRARVWGEDGQRGLWQAALRRVFIDADGDGDVDEGEIEQVTGARVGRLGTFTSAAKDNPNIYRNGRRTF
jgi:hypothetical protein